jgi:two-component system NarL family sensor kinase
MKNLYVNKYIALNKFLLIRAIFCMCLFLIENGNAQIFFGAEFDKAKNQAIENLKSFPDPDTNRVIALAEIFDKAVFNTQRKQVISYVDEARALSRQLRYDKGLVSCYYWYGNYYMSKISYDTAITYFDSAISTCIKHHELSFIRLTALNQRAKGQIYLRQEDYTMALQYFLEALKYYEQNPEEQTLFIYRDIVNIYDYLNNLDKTLYYGQLEAKTAEQLKNTSAYAGACLNYAGILIKANRLQDAQAQLDKIAVFMPDTVEVNITYGYYLKRGEIAGKNGKSDSAMYYFKTALIYAEQSKHGSAINNVLDLLCAYSLRSGDVTSALQYANRNLRIANEQKNKLNKIGALMNLSQCYEQLKNYNAAYSYLKEAVLLKDSLMKESSIMHINRLETQYQNQQKQRTIDLLQNVNEKQLIALENKKNLNRVLILLVIAFIISGFLGYQYFKKRQELQKQVILDLEKDKQIRTIDAMLQGQEDERSRLAKDLHDGLGGMLSGIKISLVNMKENMIMDQENLVKFERSIDLMDSSIRELRHVAHNLMPEALVKLGLEEALMDYSQMIETNAGIKVVYQHFGNQRKLGNTADVFIYRIIQELVNNVIKHAEASEILIQLIIHDDSVNIAVEDNGKGFDVTSLNETKGMGFKNIRYRLDYFHGSMDVKSEVNKGTSVNINLIV